MTDISSVSAVVCTLNSISSIRECLTAARESGVGEVIVVDGHSTDGTLDVARELADKVVNDERKGLGFARNLGIAESKGDYILNLGSDNVITRRALEDMLIHLENGHVDGVGALTRVKPQDYLSRCMNIWWKARFRPGPAAVIGTPTLMKGELLRSNPFNSDRRFSDDSELCERWNRNFGSQFMISSAQVLEVGKTNWSEISARAKIYGISDSEVFEAGIAEGWDLLRRMKSISHPMRVDYFEVVRHSSPLEAIYSTPFLLFFTSSRYLAWWRVVRSR
jgi:glycosyltransferase involved in cell wall biosynthesis